MIHSIVYLVIAVLIAIFVLLYLFNPKDIFGIDERRRERIKEIESINRDSEFILNIFSEANTPRYPSLKNMLLLSNKFLDCYENLRYSKSPFYRLFGTLSLIISKTLFYAASHYFEEPNYGNEIHKQLLANISGLCGGIKEGNKHLCYESLVKIVALSHGKIPVQLTSKELRELKTLVNQTTKIIIEQKDPSGLQREFIKIWNEKPVFSGEPNSFIFLAYLSKGINEYLSKLYQTDPQHLSEIDTKNTQKFVKICVDFALSYTKGNIDQQYRAMVELVDLLQKYQERELFRSLTRPVPYQLESDDQLPIKIAETYRIMSHL